MDARRAAAVVGMGIFGAAVLAVALRAAWMTSAKAQRAAVEPPMANTSTSQRVRVPDMADEKSLMKLADRICNGDVDALTELNAATERLFESDDHVRDVERLQSNLRAADTAFRRIGQAAGESNAAALSALRQSLDAGKYSNGLSTVALGTAATAGNTEAMEMLLHPEEFGILQELAVRALSGPANAGDADAMTFLIGVLGDEKADPLTRQAAADVIRKRAALGDADALAAMKQYDAENGR